MALISDSTYRMTWGDFFSMDGETYALKQKIIQIRDHGLEKKLDHPLDTFRCLRIDVKWLIRDVSENPILSKCPETSKVLIALKNKVDSLVDTTLRMTLLGKVKEHDSNWEPAMFDAVDISSAMASSDNLWWPCIHVPFEVEVAVPHSQIDPDATTDAFSSWS